MRIDWYVFREWLKVFIMTLFVLFGLLIISDLQDNLPDLLGFGASNAEILRYYAIKLPSFVPIVVPMGFMVSLLFSLGQFHRNHEITAMRAAGFSLFRITRSLWASGLVLTVILFQMNARIIPWSVEEARQIWNDYAYSKALQEEANEEVGLLYNLTFFNRRDGRLWFLNRFNEYNYRGFGITISELNPENGQELRRIAANRGYYDDLNGGWTFNEGRETTFDESSGDPVRSLPFDQLHMAGFTEDPDLMKALEKRPKDLSLSELKTVVDYLRPAEDPRLATYAVTFYDRLFSPVSCLIILGLAIPFSVTGVRTNPFVGVSKAMGLLFLYYILLNVAQFAGTSGFNPLLAASLPNVAAFALIGWYFIKLQHP
ncbi:MAG: LptF/LptG family permease [Puniceicoccaceae bacterium]